MVNFSYQYSQYKEDNSPPLLTQEFCGTFENLYTIYEGKENVVPNVEVNLKFIFKLVMIKGYRVRFALTLSFA